MTQGMTSFWDYDFTAQSKNSLLNSTQSYLDKQKLCHQLEAGMEEQLSKKVNAEKVNKEADFRKWIVEVKRIDKGMKSECEEFECIMIRTRDTGCHVNSLSEPSQRANNVFASATLSSTNASDRTHYPQLTKTECKIIFDNKGCLHCCQL